MAWKFNKPTRLYTRHYSDNEQTTSYLEWADALYAANPRFDRTRFLKACGPE